MTLEIRPTGNPAHFDLYDGDEKIGEIVNTPLDEEGIELGEPPIWGVTMWSLMGTGKEWDADETSYEAAEQAARVLYEEFCAERRELSRGARPWITGSVPMGGKPGWRRR